MEDYYNTNKETGNTLRESKNKAGKQQEEILSFFMLSPGEHFTPCELWQKLFNKNVPLTSVRRAITNIEHRGIIIKTDLMRKGYYGKKVHTWKFPLGKPKQKSMF